MAFGGAVRTAIDLLVMDSGFYEEQGAGPMLTEIIETCLRANVWNIPLCATTAKWPNSALLIKARHNGRASGTFCHIPYADKTWPR